MRIKFLSFLLLLNTVCLYGEPSEEKLRALYNSLDPASISQHLAFYELYPQSSRGQQALKEAWKLLAGSSADKPAMANEIPLSGEVINALVGLVNKPIDQELSVLDSDSIEILKQLSKRLHHAALKGHQVWNEEEIFTLPLEEIDIARGLFVSQFGTDQQRILSYEALIDLMALQILARLPNNPSPEQKIHAINAFIFDDMGFRFPPHSLYAKEIDLYTFLPSVLDSRRGVCLGVSILYLCIAQRLSLPLEMITPPGHIYVRYRSGDQIINIETTARGIHINSEEYLGINTRSLQKRTIREVIGMAHFNQASIFWQNGDYEKALHSYQKAEPYLKEDPLLKELMGYILLLTGNKEKGEQNLREIQHYIPDHALTKNTMVEDYFLGNIDAKGISVIFKKVDDDRQSVLAKKEALEKTLSEFPRFRSGQLSLAVTWLQLHRMGEALEVLNAYQLLDQGDPEAQYYLAVLHAQRRDFPKAWHHLHKAEAIVKTHQYSPKALKELRRELLTCCPESYFSIKMD